MTKKMIIDADIYLSCRLQIVDLIAEKTFINISVKYANFANVFLSYTKINNHVIKLVNCQQSPYGSIYSLGLIGLFKLSINASIVFDRKLDGFFWLCVDYKSFNNFTIKNQYPLPLVKESLDRLKRAR